MHQHHASIVVLLIVIALVVIMAIGGAWLGHWARINNWGE